MVGISVLMLCNVRIGMRFGASLFFILTMCRLFAYSSKDPVATTSQLLVALREFGALATTGNVPNGKEKGHKHGWGVVAYKDGVVCLYVRGIVPADEDPLFEKTVAAISDIKPQFVIAHLRKASVGSVIMQNVQPFCAHQYAFCHNGSIQEFSPVSPDASDSLSFFTNLVSNISNKSFIEYKKEISEQHTYTAMNMLYCDGKEITYSRDWNENYPEAETLGLGDYYTLYEFTGGNASFICSQPLASFSELRSKLIDNKTIGKIQ